MYQKIKNEGGDLRAFLKRRRSPRGTTVGTPLPMGFHCQRRVQHRKAWLKVNPNYKTVNVVAEEAIRIPHYIISGRW